MSFQFRFARLKSIRELEEDLAQQRLALARQEEKLQEERLQAAQRIENDAYRGLARPHYSTPLDWELEVRNCHDLTYRTLQQRQNRVKAYEQTQAEREQLMLRMQKAKIMQSLHDRHSELYQRQDALAEQKILDELGGVQYLRNRQTGR